MNIYMVGSSLSFFNFCFIQIFSYVKNFKKLLQNLVGYKPQIFLFGLIIFNNNDNGDDDGGGVGVGVGIDDDDDDDDNGVDGDDCDDGDDYSDLVDDGGDNVDDFRYSLSRAV